MCQCLCMCACVSVYVSVCPANKVFTGKFSAKEWVWVTHMQMKKGIISKQNSYTTLNGCIAIVPYISCTPI